MIRGTVWTWKDCVDEKFMHHCHCDYFVGCIDGHRDYSLPGVLKDCAWTIDKIKAIEWSIV